MKKGLKILLIFAIIFNTFCLGIGSVFADDITATINDKDGVYVRSGAGTNNDKTALLSYGTKIILVSETKYDGTGCDGWYQINYNGNTNSYICSELVVINSSNLVNNSGYYTTANYGYRINEDYATVRSSASSSGSKIEIIYLGTQVTILGTAVNNSDSSCKKWTKISYYNKTGYVCSNLVSSYNDITATDTEYFKVLENAGFPESYWPFLTYLHQLHPNWIFTASITNKNFNDAVNGESSKNALQTTYDSYRTSSTLRESPNWYTTTDAVNAFYLDPRNYLTERNIFAFENLQYDETNHTAEAVKSIFGSSYLATDEYVGYFMTAAKTYNISPIHLASRAKQEGMTNESYVMVSGTASSVGGIYYEGKNLDGVYNYYNIGSYGTVPVARGLAVAKGLVGSSVGIPWDTREKAIIYGASFIANNYVNAGQNTLYYQKFNTGPSADYSSYTHQYMTNIIAPAGESLSTYYSYANQNLLDTAFVFSIPVYKNMPDVFTTHPPVGNINNELTDIKINDITISEFDSDILTYEKYIAKNTTTINIKATAYASTSTITGIGDIAITEDTTEVKITVTSEIGSSKTYTISLIKADSNVTTETTIEEILENVDVKINETYMSGIEVNTTPTSLINNINIKAPDTVISITDKNGTNKTTALATGDVINIKNGTNEKSYTIVIKGDNSGDGKITAVDLLRVQKHILGYSTLTGAYKEACDTNYDSKITAVDLLRVQKHILGYLTLK